MTRAEIDASLAKIRTRLDGTGFATPLPVTGGKLPFEISFEHRLINPLNGMGRTAGNWRARAAIGTKEKDQLRWKILAGGFALLAAGVQPPYLVTLTRIGVGRMDYDGVVASFKKVRDCVAEQLHVDDGDEARIWFDYKQESGAKVYGVRIRVERMTDPPAVTP